MLTFMFSKEATEILNSCSEVASAHNSSAIAPEHLLLAILKAPSGSPLTLIDKISTGSSAYS
ncbi:MAG: hypothetical protein K2H74_02065, partial [Paramuribaculum sp.]|nr:hypothetical protein [Paramuribaculum sp.]